MANCAVKSVSNGVTLGRMSGLQTRLANGGAAFAAAALVAATLMLGGCGGGGGGGDAPGTTFPVPNPSALTLAALSSVVPASGATGVSRDVKPVINLGVKNATSSDGGKLLLVCAGKTIAFTSTSSLSADASSMTVTLAPQTGAILAGDACTLNGNVSTSGTSGAVNTTVATAFTVLATPNAKKLSLVAGSPDQVGSRNGSLPVANFHAPVAMTRDAQGNIFVADGYTGFFDSHGLIRKISPTGDVTTIAGSAFYGGTPKDGTGSQAAFKSITGITASPDGNLYTIDASTQVVQKVTPQGVVTTIAGSLNQPGTTDGPGLTARFQGAGITSDAQGNLFIADTANHTIRKIALLGNVTTYAGRAGDAGVADGALLTARFKFPYALKFDSAGKLFVADQAGLRVIENDAVTTQFSIARLMGDICGAGLLVPPTGLDVSSDNRIAISFADCRRVGVYRGNQLLSRLGGEGLIVATDLAVDVDGLAADARFQAPAGVTFSPIGELIIADQGNRNLKRSVFTATITGTTAFTSLFAGQRNTLNPVDGKGGAARINNPFCLYYASSGDTYFSQDASIVRRVDAAGNVATVFKAAGATTQEPNGPTSACVVKVNADGTLIVAANVSVSGMSRGEMRLYSAAGVYVRTLAAMSDSAFPLLLQSTVNTAGDIFFNDPAGFIRKYAGSTITTFSDIKIEQGTVGGMALASSGEIIVAGGCTVSKISATGTVSPVTLTTLNPCGYQDGSTATAKFQFISGLAIGADGAIYLSDRGASVIRRILSGNVDTLYGTTFINETELGADSGKLFDPRQIAYDATGNSIVIMSGNALLRAVVP